MVFLSVRKKEKFSVVILMQKRYT